MTWLLALPARLKLWALAAGATVLAVLGIYAKGRSDEAHKAKVKDLKADIAAHERINNADTGAGASDDERIDRLRDFAAKHGNRQAKGKGSGLRGGTR